MSSQVLSRMLRVLRTLHLDKIQHETSTYPFTDYFKDFEKIQAVRQIFGEETDVLRNLKDEFTWIRSYMWVSSEDGHLVVSSWYLKNGDLIDIYLDIIHELVHVKQFIDGKELFDSSHSYVDRPTEVEAYRHVVEEARNLGLSDERICDYLKTEWMIDEDLKQLAKTLNVKYVSIRNHLTDQQNNKLPDISANRVPGSSQRKLPVRRT